MIRQRKYLALALLLALSFGTITQTGCDKDAQRKLLKAEDDASVLIQKLEQARTDLLVAGKIDQPTATGLDRILLKVNTAVKHVSTEGDRYAADPSVGPSATRAAIEEFRQVLQEAKGAVADGSLGVKNADSKQNITSLLTSLQSIAAIVANVVTQIEQRKK